MDLSLRLETFLEVCYNNNIAKFASAANITGSTLARWLKGADLKYSNLIMFEQAGCNIGWLTSGMGNMFANNEIGDKLKNDIEIQNKIKDIYKQSFTSTIFIDLRESLISDIKKVHDVEEKNQIFLTKTMDIFNELNKKCHYIFINILLVNISEKIQSVLQEERFFGIDKKENINKFWEDIKEGFLPVLSGILFNYIGGELKNILLTEFGDFFDDFLVDESTTKTSVIDDGHGLPDDTIKE
jgi:hypothetical protein